MSQKCVHKGCGKSFVDPDEECVYHSGPPIFHEGQKGWQCCKPRVLSFEDFLKISPCTTGKHSTVEDAPLLDPNPQPDEVAPLPTPAPVALDAHDNNPASLGSRVSQAMPPPPFPSDEPSEDENDDPLLPVPPNATCRRRGCNITSNNHLSSRGGEECVHHPGQPVFHEGSKGWTCCKKRVLEFDEFMKIKGCKTKDRHLFVGAQRDTSIEEVVDEVRHDFYQTPTTVVASFFLKRIDKDRVEVKFASPTVVDLDLPTTENKRYRTQIPLFGRINIVESSFKIMGTKLELKLVKADGINWRMLRNDKERNSEIVQVDRAPRT